MIGELGIQTRIADYINDVLSRFEEGMDNINEDITDRVFLMIQGNLQLRREYDDLITSKHGLNALLGKRIREYFCLQNIGRCHNPKSRLIKSYERHAK